MSLSCEEQEDFVEHMGTIVVVVAGRDFVDVKDVSAFSVIVIDETFDSVEGIVVVEKSFVDDVSRLVCKTVVKVADPPACKRHSQKQPEPDFAPVQSSALWNDEQVVVVCDSVC